MVTRDIKKNTATQVNANLIGVQVHPEVVPPTYEVVELTANVGINHLGCTATSNGLPMLYMNYGDIWAYTGSQEEYGGTFYNVWSCVFGIDPGYNMFTDPNDSITDNTQFYIHIDDPNVPPVVSGPRSDYMLSYTGDLRHFDPNDEFYYVSDDIFVSIYLNWNPECELVDGFFVSRETGMFIGKIVSEEYGYEEFLCTYDVESGDYFQWRIHYADNLYVYSTVRNPAVGDNLISNDQGTEAYTSQITEIYEDELDPGYTEDVDCKVEYSVDGETWTEWPDNLTDDNNVIANIPRYMYLKFGQDVEITEE